MNDVRAASWWAWTTSVCARVLRADLGDHVGGVLALEHAPQRAAPPAGEVLPDPGGRRGREQRRPGRAGPPAPRRPPAAPSAFKTPSGVKYVPWMSSSSTTTRAPQAASRSAIHAAAWASPGEQGRRSSAASAATSACRASCVGVLTAPDIDHGSVPVDRPAEADPNLTTRRADKVPPCPPPTPTACSARSSPARSRPRSSPRTSGRSPSWTSTRPRAGTPSSSPATHARDLLEIEPEDLAAVAHAAQRLAAHGQGDARGRRHQPPQQLRRRRVADRLPLPLARHPALRGRPAALALDPRTRRHGRDPSDRPAAEGALLVTDVVRLEQEGPLAVLTFDSPPLNLFDDAVFDGLRARDRQGRRRPAARPADPRRGQGRLRRRRRRQGLRRHVAAARRRAVGRAAGDHPHDRGAAAADGLRRARALPDRRLRDRAGLRHPAGRASARSSGSSRSSSA